MKSLSIKKLSLQHVSIGAALLCAPIMSWQALQEFDKIALFGFFLLPFIIRIDKQSRGSYRYLILALVFCGLHILFGQSYWSLACALSLIFSVIDLRIGKLNKMAFYALIFYLPITRSFFLLFGFYIRLEITKWATSLVSLFHPNVRFEGTQIFNGMEQFSVDAGCMGLRLVITGFLLTLLILNQRSLHYKVKIKPKAVSLFLFLSFLLVVQANFFRIVALILFESAEETMSHELIGLAAFVLFHLIPMTGLITLSFKKGWMRSHTKTAHHHEPPKAVYFGILVMSMIMTLGPHQNTSASEKESLTYSFTGFEAKKSIDGIVTYSRGNSLFTIKPINPLSFSNHHPMMCWRGDGFDVSNESRGKIGEYTCMQATLKSPAEQTLNTVWWYSNEDDYTSISELEWRYRALFKKEHFYLYNFTSDQHDELIYTINLVTQEMANQNKLIES